MSRHTRIRTGLSSLYGIAIVVAIFTGGLIPVLIIGAVAVAGLSTILTRGGPAPGDPGRQRNRNRYRNR